MTQSCAAPRLAEVSKLGGRIALVKVVEGVQGEVIEAESETSETYKVNYPCLQGVLALTRLEDLESWTLITTLSHKAGPVSVSVTLSKGARWVNSSLQYTYPLQPRARDLDIRITRSSTNKSVLVWA